MASREKREENIQDRKMVIEGKRIKREDTRENKIQEKTENDETKEKRQQRRCKNKKSREMQIERRDD